MNKQEAEVDIVQCVKNVDAIRANKSLTDVEKDERILVVEMEIKELKKITGQRFITGSARIGGG